MKQSIGGIGALLVATFLATACVAEETPDFRDSLGYDPSPAFPNGRANPDAPAELKQFAFFIGEFECVDRQRNQKGEWSEFPAIWNASYFLNGFGIQDKYYAPNLQTSNVRMFFPGEKVWKVSYFSAPGFASGEWVGEKTGDAIVLERKILQPSGVEIVSRLSFFEISNAGFEWKSEILVPNQDPLTNWTSSCQRRAASPS